MNRAASSRRIALIGAAASAAALVLPRRNALAREPVVHEVRIKSFRFVPDRIEVSVGDIVRWINDDLAPHTATAENSGWDTGEIGDGDSAEIIVQMGSETSYFCAFHPHMKGSFDIR